MASVLFLLLNALRKKSLRIFEFGAARSAQTAACTVDEVREHTHTRSWSFGRNLLRRQRSSHCGGIFGEQSLRRERGDGFHTCEPTSLRARLRFGGCLARAACGGRDFVGMRISWTTSSS